MQKSKIEWTDYTINPVRGLCPMDCKDNQGKSYCYARRMYKRFKWNPEIHYLSPQYLDDELSTIEKPSRIFWGSTMELFHDSLANNMRLDMFDLMRGYFHHTHIILTKQPQNLIKWSPFPDNCWVGVSVSDKLMYADALHYLSNIGATVHFISFEPLLSWDDVFPKADGDRMLDHMIDWIIIGQQTPIKQSTMPESDWVEEIVEAADKARIPVFLKNNLWNTVCVYEGEQGVLFNEHGTMRQEFPQDSKGVEKMKLVYGISRWTNASRASARHIDNGEGKPLCNDKRKVSSWEREEGEPTCQRCKYLYQFIPKS